MRIALNATNPCAALTAARQVGDADLVVDRRSIAPSIF
jgi:hypothetical protein